MVTLAIVSDTHLPGGRRALPAECIARMTAADAILHAGDLVTMEVLRDLRTLGPPVFAVHGNVDEPALHSELPESVELEFDGVRLAMLHDAGPASGRLARMRIRFPGCRAVVFGHSHIPLLEQADGFAIFNPGSPTDRRRQPRPSMGFARVAPQTIRFELVELDET